MIRQSSHIMITLVGLVLLCQACGRGEEGALMSTIDTQFSSSVVDSDAATLRERSETGNRPLGVMVRRPVSYLEEVVSPCVPFESSGQDPCFPIILRPVEAPVGVTTTLLRFLPSLTNMLLGRGFSIAAPHIVVRGTVQPDTTRCDMYPINWFDHDKYHKTGYILKENTFYYCFAEINVNEYIVGEGPANLTVSFYNILVDRPSLGEMPVIGERDELEAYSRVSKYEGKELVLFLGIPWTTAIEAWEISPLIRRLWFVQRNGDEIRAVAESITRTTNPELRSQMNLPLDELVRKIREAAEERFVLTGGRIGVDSSLPMLVTDANKLQEFYQNTGAVYEGENATVLPPPVPGGEEPELPPTRTGEEQPDATTVPVPGDEIYPTTTDDASPPLSSTTITTLVQTEDTSTTTTVATTSTSTTLPQTEDTLPTTATTTVPVPTGTTRPQVEEPVPAATSTTEASSGDTTGTTLPPVEDTLPAATGTTVGSAPPSTGAVPPPGVGEPGEPPVEDTDPAPAGTVPPPPDDETGVPAGGDGSGVGAG